jgi:DNA-binding NtrC family response regulator
MQSKAILIIDYEKAVRDSLQLVMREEGYTCFTSKDEAGALKALETENIGIVILDSEFAVKTNLLKCIKDQKQFLKSIVLASYVSLETCRLALMKEADEFLLKPLDFDDLIALVNKLKSSLKKQ